MCIGCELTIGMSMRIYECVHIGAKTYLRRIKRRWSDENVLRLKKRLLSHLLGSPRDMLSTIVHVQIVSGRTSGDECSTPGYIQIESVCYEKDLETDTEVKPKEQKE